MFKFEVFGRIRNIEKIYFPETSGPQFLRQNKLLAVDNRGETRQADKDVSLLRATWYMEDLESLP